MTEFSGSFTSTLSLSKKSRRPGVRLFSVQNLVADKVATVEFGNLTNNDGHVFWGQLKGDNNTIYYYIYCNNVGLIPKVPKTYASESPENPCFRLPHCRLTPHVQGTPENFRINLILAETTVIGLHLRRGKYRSIFIQIFLVGSKRRMCFETDCIMAFTVIQGR